uniref:NADH dehydrogenase [ubiquinone] 1 beta subcomplex subunit 10 n=1 Tax=Xenopsylla cheopis TaxID=163159 RepID=A0A6M2DU84_XENCH
MSSNEGKSTFESFLFAVSNTLQAPVIWFRETVVVPNQKSYPWYHQKFRRVPTIDTCYTDDPICEYEANQQFKRDKLVDSEILNILRQRFEDCSLYEEPDDKEKCKVVLQQYKDASTDWFIKCNLIVINIIL